MESILNLIEKQIFDIKKKILEQKDKSICSIDLEKIYLDKLRKLNIIKSQIPNSFHECQTLEHIEKLALAKLDLNAVSYFISGANSEITLKRNKDYFKNILIKQRFFKNKNTEIKTSNIDISLGNKSKEKNNFSKEEFFTFENINNNNNNSIANTQSKELINNEKFNKDSYLKIAESEIELKINLSTKIFNKEISIPIGLAPSALHKLANENGEIASAKSSFKNNSIFILSSRASCTIAEVAKANQTGTRWFQLYVMKNKEDNIRLIKEAEKYGFSALVLTVDAPTIGYRDRDFQIRFKKPENIFYAIEKNLIEEKIKEIEKIDKIKNDDDNYNDNVISQKNSLINNVNLRNKNITNTNDNYNNQANFNYYKNQTDSSLDWNIIFWLSEITKLPIILKGITNCEDALKAASINEIAGIVISNHGGRQLDTTPSTIEVLERIKNELDSFNEIFPNKRKLEVFIDSGFRTGSDIFKALAYGAKAVFLGRPIIWGLAAGGELGVDKVFYILKDELEKTMKIAGCRKIEDIDSNCVYKYNYSKF